MTRPRKPPFNSAEDWGYVPRKEVPLGSRRIPPEERSVPEVIAGQDADQLPVLARGPEPSQLDVARPELVRKAQEATPMSRQTKAPGQALEPGVAYMPRRQVLSVACPGRFSSADRAKRERIRARRTYVLALDESTVLSAVRGKVRVGPAREALVPVYALPVEILCDGWGVTLETLDATTRAWFTPDAGTVHESPRPRVRASAAAELWREARRVSLRQTG